MPRRIAVVLVLAAALSPAAPAGAKGILGAQACGSDGCRETAARGPHDEAMMQAAGSDVAPRRGAPFYRVRFAIGEPGGEAHGEFRIVFVPSLHLTSSVDDATGARVWSRTTATSQAALERAVRGLAPYPAARLPLARGDAAPVRSGALPPEVVTAPGTAKPSGTAAWPWAAAGLAAAGALALLATGLTRGRRRRAAAVRPTASP